MARTPKVVEDRHEQIIDAALRVFAEKGFARATNRDIAHAAGITTGLIYYYFKSKEDLLKAALEERSPVHLVAQISPEMLEQPPVILLPILIARVLGMVESEQFVNIIRVLLPEMLHGRDTEVASIIVSFFQRVLGFLSNYLKLQVAKGGARANLDADMTAQVIASSMIGMVLRRQIIRDPSVLHYTPEELVTAILDTFLQGILPQ
ncbi:MAG TPA: helix-turn-helix domain-containing protein [Ktedonobacteraceae bacterium]|jgi:AcrR family transcriptional regulator